jgi:phage terminase small subunit
VGLHAPAHLSDKSKRLYRTIADDYDLIREAHCLELLRMALEQMDRAEQARQQIAKDGAYSTNRHGEVRPHPGIGVEKDATTLAARMFRELALDPAPPIEDDARPPRLRSVG